MNKIKFEKLNEAVVFSLPDDNGCYSKAAAKEVRGLLEKMDAVLIGCGMGQSDGTLSVLQTVLSEAACPVIVDADGINLLAAHKDILRGRKADTVLTPHAGEFERLFGPILPDRKTAAEALSQELGCITLLKGHGTVVTDGNKTYRNPTGNPGMAVGGSGDLLAGIIVSLLGQGLPSLEAAAIGAWLHGAAGDLCAQQIGQYGMLPTDMLQVLPRLMK